jgi:hypothetical protein
MADKRPPIQMVNSAFGAKSVRVRRTSRSLKVRPPGCLGSLISLREQRLRVRPATLCAAFDRQATVVAERRVAVLPIYYGTEHWPVAAEEAAKTHRRKYSSRSDGEEGGLADVSAPCGRRETRSLRWSGMGKRKQDKGSASRHCPSDCLHIVFSRDFIAV